MSTILVIGDIYVETQYFTYFIPDEDEFALADEATVVAGSKTINCSRALVRLGDEVFFFGKVGNDAEGKYVIEQLKTYGIKTLVGFSSEKTGKIAVITPKTGKSSITLFRGANQSVTSADINKVLNAKSEIGYVYAATNLPLSTLYSLVKTCKKEKKVLFLDIPNQQTELDLEQLKTVDFFMPNRQEAGLIARKMIQSVDEAMSIATTFRNKLQGNIIITLDKDGCVVLKKDSSNPQYFPTHQIERVDETASGDIFRGMLASQIMKGKEIEEAVKEALFVATESVTIKGVNLTLETLIR